MARVIQRFTALGLTIALSIVLVSCGGGGGGSSNSSNEAVGSGTVGILLTDKPADPDMFDSINAFIEKVELLGSDALRQTLAWSAKEAVLKLAGTGLRLSPRNVSVREVGEAHLRIELHDDVAEMIANLGNGPLTVTWRQENEDEVVVTARFPG